MDIASILPILMFAALLALLMIGYPVAFTLAGTALLFGLIGAALDIFYLSDLGFIPNRIWGIMSNFTLVAVPLFVFMGLVLEKSGIAEELLNTFCEALQGVRGSLVFAVVVVGTVLAASTGIVGATVVTMGVLSLPSMLQQGYDKQLSCGVVAASGTLGQIIPPSIVLVLLGDMMSIDVGDLFAGAMIPGLVLVCAYLAYLAGSAVLTPHKIPKSTCNERPSLKKIFIALLPPAFLVLTVLGSILFGLASPTEAAACGAAGAVLIGYVRKKIDRSTLWNVAKHTSQITSMVFMILIGAQFFGVVFRGLSGDDVIIDFISDIEASRYVVLFGIMVLIFVLGFFLDFLEICFIIVPIILPLLQQLGFDPLWVAVLIAINLQTSFLTPPFGFSLFYLKGVVPEDIETTMIYRGVTPFVLIQIAVLVLVAMFPALVTWLPKVAF